MLLISGISCCSPSFFHRITHTICNSSVTVFFFFFFFFYCTCFPFPVFFFFFPFFCSFPAFFCFIPFLSPFSRSNLFSPPLSPFTLFPTLYPLSLSLSPDSFLCLPLEINFTLHYQSESLQTQTHRRNHTNRLHTRFQWAFPPGLTYFNQYKHVHTCKNTAHTKEPRTPFRHRGVNFTVFSRDTRSKWDSLM